MRYALIQVADQKIIEQWEAIPKTVNLPVTQEVVTNPFFGWDNGEYRIVKIDENGKILSAMTNDPKYGRVGIGR